MVIPRNIVGDEGISPRARARPGNCRVWDNFLVLRAKMLGVTPIAYAAACEDDLNVRTVTHALFGGITCYEGMLFLAGHALRHAAQVREIKPDRAYPVTL